jgi:hypothetical protein
MRAFALVASTSIFLLSKSLLACSVCGCDPSGGTLGLDRPTSGDLRLAVEDRYLQKESGSVDDGSREGEREDRIGVRFQYSPPVPRLSFQFEVPFYAWKAHYGVTGLQDDTSQGLSDVALTARWEALHLGGGIVPRHVVALLGTLKAPTGNNNHLAAVDNGQVDEHKQIGTGSWDEMLGLWYSYGDFPTVVYAGVSARINGSNGRGNHYGNALFGTLGVRRSFLEDKRLFFAIDAQVRNAGKDTVPTVPRSYDPNSGGFVGYATGTAGYSITDNFLARATVQVPVVTALNGVQSEHPVAYLALAYDFTL